MAKKGTLKPIKVERESLSEDIIYNLDMTEHNGLGIHRLEYMVEKLEEKLDKQVRYIKYGVLFAFAVLGALGVLF